MKGCKTMTNEKNKLENEQTIFQNEIILNQLIKNVKARTELDLCRQVISVLRGSDPAAISIDHLVFSY